MEIRGKTISYSTFKKKNASKRESQLEKRNTNSGTKLRRTILA